MKFRKKPVVIEAFQWTGQPKEEWPIWFQAQWENVGVDADDNGSAILVIPTLEGPLTASYNDWIIQGIQGELYPCKPDIFEATYELAE